MPKTILINGAFGRMGQLACATIEKHPNFTLIAKTGRNDDLNHALATYCPDIVLDLTNATCVWENAQIMLQHRAFPIIGASGLKKEQIDCILSKSNEVSLGGLIIPNFSLGAVLQMRCAEQVARYFAKAEIIEAHHEKKLDAPSGTALATAARIEKVHPTSACKTPIHSVRLPGLVAQQEIIFGAEAETLSIVHNVLNREAYMPGLILACQKVTSFNRMYYGLDICLEG
ncbi:MAG: 4-hydroxy-tetrahydrodipicolinate reductase [Gammaproteobacteria bacterium]|nr:4-hydroxy-tetrahydrodipicolinate reductase [Gammaproteobacteria bacterium]